MSVFPVLAFILPTFGLAVSIRTFPSASSTISTNGQPNSAIVSTRRKKC